jgi:hypothetical protein
MSEAKNLSSHPAMKCAFVFLFISLLLVSAGHAQPRPYRGYNVNDPMARTAQDDYNDLWHGLDVGTANLQKSVGVTNAEAAALLSQIRTNAHFLEKKWDAWFRAHQFALRTYSGADDYLITLRASNHQLAKLKKEKSPDKFLPVLRDVAFDMQLKADNCRNSGDGLGKEIRVKVHTKSNGKEIGGYEVFFVSQGMFDVKSAHDRFPRQSSPTDEKILCPGGYAFWARKQNQTTEPVKLGVGGHGEKNLEVDIEVPAE